VMNKLRIGVLETDLWIVETNNGILMVGKDKRFWNAGAPSLVSPAVFYDKITAQRAALTAKRRMTTVDWTRVSCLWSVKSTKHKYGNRKLLL